MRRWGSVSGQRLELVAVDCGPDGDLSVRREAPRPLHRFFKPAACDPAAPVFVRMVNESGAVLMNDDVVRCRALRTCHGSRGAAPKPMEPTPARNQGQCPRAYSSAHFSSNRRIRSISWRRRNPCSRVRRSSGVEVARVVGEAAASGLALMMPPRSRYRLLADPVLAL